MAGSALLVSAAHKSSGKTTVTVGLAAALARQGLAVQAFKKGPDYIDPMWLARASGRPCYNLDARLMHDHELAATFVRHAGRAAISLVEGNKGLHDGVSLDGSDSNAALARRLALPVLLVIDARGMTRGVAPLVLGYQAFDRELRIGGVILNRVGGPRHEAKLRAVLEHYTDVPVLGAVHQDERLALAERHLGLLTDRECGEAQARVAAMADAVAAQVDLARVIALAGTRRVIDALPPGADAPAGAARASSRPVRIGIARDAAFCFYYPDDLQALEDAGATLVPFDTLRDARLPEVDGVFIGGGFPESFMAELEANRSLRADLRARIEAGLPAYAECGGLMYLARRLHSGERSAEMVGAIPGDVRMHARPVGRGYVQLAETADMPWPAIDPDDATPAAVRGHEFHHSALEGVEGALRCAWRVQRGHGIGGGRDGVCVHNLVASYSHLRHCGGTRWPQRFVAFVREQAECRSTAHAMTQQTTPAIVPLQARSGAQAGAWTQRRAR